MSTGPRSPLVAIVAYRNTDGLAQALESLDGGEVLVIDNGSDEDVRLLTEQHGAIYLAPPKNIGFAAAMNLVLARRDGRDVLLLNPDARIAPDLPARLVEVLRTDSRLAAVAPCLLAEDGRPQKVEWPFPSPREAWLDAIGIRRVVRPRNTFLIGAVLLLRHEALEDVGLFDERFFVYAEECDWQLRAFLRGWRVALDPHLVAYHEGGGSSASDDERWGLVSQSARLFALKWYGRWGWRSMRAAFLLGTFVRLLCSLPRPEARARYARLLGF